MNDERRILVGCILVALVLGWLVLNTSTRRSTSTEPNARPTAEPSRWAAHRGGDGRGAGSIMARGIDAAVPSPGWRASELDPTLLDQVLERPIDVVLLDVGTNAELIPWVDGLITDDDPFGRAVAECRRTYERRQRSRCNWDQDVVLRRSPSGETSVVAVAPRTTPGEHSPQTSEMARDCRAWARCVASAWEGRPGRFPQGVEDRVTTADDGAQLIALRTAVHHLEAYGLEPPAYQARYEDAMAKLEDKLRRREQAYASAEDEGLRSRRSLENLYYNLLLERGRHEDYRRYLEYLKEHERP